MWVKYLSEIFSDDQAHPKIFLLRKFSKLRYYFFPTMCAFVASSFVHSFTATSVVQ